MASVLAKNAKTQARQKRELKSGEATNARPYTDNRKRKQVTHTARLPDEVQMMLCEFPSLPFERSKLILTQSRTKFDSIGGQRTRRSKPTERRQGYWREYWRVYSKGYWKVFQQGIGHRIHSTELAVETLPNINAKTAERAPLFCYPSLSSRRPLTLLKTMRSKQRTSSLPSLSASWLYVSSCSTIVLIFSNPWHDTLNSSASSAWWSSPCLDAIFPPDRVRPIATSGDTSLNSAEGVEITLQILSKC